MPGNGYYWNINQTGISCKYKHKNNNNTTFVFYQLDKSFSYIDTVYDNVSKAFEKFMYIIADVLVKQS